MNVIVHSKHTHQSVPDLQSAQDLFLSTLKQSYGVDPVHVSVDDGKTFVNVIPRPFGYDVVRNGDIVWASRDVRLPVVLEYVSSLF